MRPAADVDDPSDERAGGRWQVASGSWRSYANVTPRSLWFVTHHCSPFLLHTSLVLFTHSGQGQSEDDTSEIVILGKKTVNDP